MQLLIFSSYLIPNATNNLGTTTESIDKAVDEWLVPICLMNIHVGDSLVKYFGDYEIAEKAYAVVANFTGMEITETGRQVMDLAKNRLAPIREEKAKRELAEKEANCGSSKKENRRILDVPYRGKTTARNRKKSPLRKTKISEFSNRGTTQKTGCDSVDINTG